MADFFFAPSKSGRSSSGFFFSPSTKSKSLSINQQIAAAVAQNQNHSSLLGSIFGKSKSGLGWALRQISRANWGMAEGTRRALEGEGVDPSEFFKGFSRGFQAKKHTTFSDVIRQEAPNFSKHHKVLTGLGGLGLDIATDPTLLLTVAATVSTGGAAAPLLAGRLAINGALRADTEVDAARAALTTARRIFKDAPDVTRAHQEWARMESAKLNTIANGQLWDEIDEAALSMAQKDAALEFESAGRKVLQPQLALPKGTRVPLLPKALSPTAPSLARTSAGKGIIAQLPLAKGTATMLGRTFKHGFDSPEFSKAALIAQHTSENLMDVYSREAAARFKQYNHLTEEDRLKALKFGEETDGIVQGKARQMNDIKLNNAVASGELTADQAGFLRAWHDYFETLRAKDKSAGIVYAKELGDHVYVPHIYTREGGVATSSQLSEAGYRLERTNRHSIDELKALKEKGDLAKNLNLETDIMTLAATRTRRAATAHSREILKDHMRRVHGTIAYVPDTVKMAKYMDRVAELRNKQAALKSHDPFHVRARRAANSRAVKRKFDKRVADSLAKRDARMAELDATFVKHAGHVWAKAVGQARTPTFKGMAKLGQKRFNDNIAHFKKADRVTARKVRAATAELNAIRRDMARLPDNAHGSKYRALWQRAVKVSKNLGRDALYKGEYVRGETWKERLVEQISHAETRAENMWQDVAAKYPNRSPGASSAILKNVDKARITAQRAHATRVQRAFQAAQLAKNRFELELADQFDKEAVKMARLQKRIDRLESRIPQLRMRNPDIAEGMMKLETKLRGEQFYFNPQVHRAMTRVERVLDDDEVMAGLVGASKKVLSYWKLGVTTVNPGYRVRNTLSDIWNMYIAGVPSAQISRYGFKAAKLQTGMVKLANKLADAHAAGQKYDLTKGEQKMLNTFNEAYNHGVLSGLFQGDIQTVAKMYRSGSFTKAFIQQHNPAALFIRWAQTFNRNGENWGRLVHYMYRREHEGASAQVAADWVKKAHFDYEELTPVERDKFKAFIPFYTWTRKNIPYQLVQLASRPGKYATFPKGIATANELATGDTETPGPQEALMPDWMRDRFAFRIPGGENLYMLPQIGVSDLSKLQQSPMRSVGEMIRPELRVLWETASGRSLLTGEEINAGRRKPISDFAGSVLSNIPGTNVGPTSRVVRGERVSGTGASPWVSYIAGQLPWANQLVNREASIKQAQQGNPTLSRLSFFGGVSTYDRDLETELTVAQLDLKDKVARIMKNLRDEGVIPPPEEKKKSPYQLSLENILRGG